MAKRTGLDDPAARDLRKRLDVAHAGLLRVHKTILDHERTRYDRSHAPVGGPMEFLQLVLNDPWFAWLRPISELIVQIDEFVSAKEPAQLSHGEALLKQAQDLLVPNETGTPFGRAYFRAMQESPDVAMAHGEWKRSMSAS
jgi:hypothetical protein